MKIVRSVKEIPIEKLHSCELYRKVLGNFVKVDEMMFLNLKLIDLSNLISKAELYIEYLS